MLYKSGVTSAGSNCGHLMEYLETSRLLIRGELIDRLRNCQLATNFAASSWSCRLDRHACGANPLRSWRQLLYTSRNVLRSDLDRDWIMCWFSSVLPQQRVDCNLRYVTSTVRYPLGSLSFDAMYVVAVSWRSGSTSYRLVHTLLWLQCPALTVIRTDCVIWRSVSLATGYVLVFLVSSVSLLLRCAELTWSSKLELLRSISSRTSPSPSPESHNILLT